MYNYSKFLSAIYAGVFLLGASMSVVPAMAVEAVAQAKTSVQVKGVVLDNAEKVDDHVLH